MRTISVRSLKAFSITLVFLGIFFLGMGTARAATLYFNGTQGDGDWTNVDNWSTDSGFTNPAGRVPGVGDDIFVEADVYFPLSGTFHVHSAQFDNAVFAQNTVGAALLTLITDATSTFSDSALSSTGTLQGTALFEGSSVNNGTVTGFTDFAGTAVNNGILNGNATFHEFSSIQGGSIGGNADFYDGSSASNGSVTGNAVFHDSSSLVEAPSTGEELFSAATITFYDMSGLYPNALHQTATFNGDETQAVTENSSHIRLTRRYTSDITTTGVFTSNGPWTIVAHGAVVNVTDATWNDTTLFVAENGGSFIGTSSALFFWTSGANRDWTNVSNWFTDSGHTNPAGRVPSVHDSASTTGTFPPTVDLDTWVKPHALSATTTGIVFTSAVGTSPDFDITASTTFINSSALAGRTVTGNVTFNDSAAFQSGVVNGNASFHGSSGGDGTINGNASFYDSSVTTATINGNAFFYDSSRSVGNISGDATFYDSSSASGGNVAGNAVFHDSSAVTGSTEDISAATMTFYDSSSLQPNVLSQTATFIGDLSEATTENFSGVPLTRRYTVNAAPTRSFFTSGPWTIIADNAIVDLTGATIDGTVTLQTVGSGSFIGGPSTPVVTVQAASSITTTGATLNGTLVTGSHSTVTDEGFQYGPTISYGSVASTTGSFSTGAFYKTITGLTCATTYHFRAFAINSSGTGTSADTTFTTSSCPSSGGGENSGGGGSSGNSSSNGNGFASPSALAQLLNLFVPYVPGCPIGYTCTVAPTPATPTSPGTPLPVSPAKTAVTTVVFTSNLNPYSTSPDVRKLQDVLRALHFLDHVSTGYYGPATIQAVRAFQKAHKIPQTGIVGPLTRAALGKK